MQTVSSVVLRLGGRKKRNIQNDVQIKSCIERYDNGLADAQQCQSTDGTTLC